MGLSKKDRYVYCYECGSRQEMNGVCKICGHTDEPPLPGMVPDVTGKKQASATKLLKGPECQLVLGNVTKENSDTIAIDLVISSDPVAGTQLQKGNPVHLVISLGPAG